MERRRYDLTASLLARQVLALPYHHRERLLAELLDSLDEGDASEVDGAAWARAWADKLEARIEDLDQGRVDTIPAEQVLADMRAAVVPAGR